MGSEVNPLPVVSRSLNSNAEQERAFYKDGILQVMYRPPVD